MKCFSVLSVILLAACAHAPQASRGPSSTIPPVNETAAPEAGCTAISPQVRADASAGFEVRAVYRVSDQATKRAFLTIDSRACEANGYVVEKQIGFVKSPETMGTCSVLGTGVSPKRMVTGGKKIAYVRFTDAHQDLRFWTDDPDSCQALGYQVVSTGYLE